MAILGAIDLETTGFSRVWDYIIEFAAVIYNEETGEHIATFQEYAKPGKKIPAKITEITGINNATVANARLEVDVLRDFLEFLAIHKLDKLGGHNAKSFDMGFLRERAAKYGFTAPDLEVIDTLYIARRMTKAGKLDVPNHKQVTIAKHFGIEYQAHSALDDVIAWIQIFEALGLNETKQVKRDKLGF